MKDKDLSVLNEREDRQPPQKPTTSSAKEKWTTAAFVCTVVTAVLAVLCVAMPILSWLLFIIGFLILILMVVCTLGTIFAFAPDAVPSFWNFLTASSDFSSVATTFCFALIPYLLGACAVLSLLTVILSATYQNKRPVGFIVVSSIFLVLSAVGIVLYFLL
ncbi:MAG: hypothetical protein IJX98_02910 [Clostridia bacterium]|nr:hypothetical protein [Clostridia bacterium]